MGADGEGARLRRDPVAPQRRPGHACAPHRRCRRPCHRDRACAPTTCARAPRSLGESHVWLSPCRLRSRNARRMTASAIADHIGPGMKRRSSGGPRLPRGHPSAPRLHAGAAGGGQRRVRGRRSQARHCPDSLAGRLRPAPGLASAETPKGGCARPAPPPIEAAVSTAPPAPTRRARQSAGRPVAATPDRSGAPNRRVCRSLRLGIRGAACRVAGAHSQASGSGTACRAAWQGAQLRPGG